MFWNAQRAVTRAMALSAGRKVNLIDQIKQGLVTQRQIELDDQLNEAADRYEKHIMRLE